MPTKNMLLIIPMPSCYIQHELFPLSKCIIPHEQLHSEYEALGQWRN